MNDLKCTKCGLECGRFNPIYFPGLDPNTYMCNKCRKENENNIKERL